MIANVLGPGLPSRVGLQLYCAVTLQKVTVTSPLVYHLSGLESRSTLLRQGLMWPRLASNLFM